MTPVSSPYIKEGMVFGTKTERRLLDALGSPDDKLKIVHIAGTNGKGSTAEFISSIIAAAGKSVGTFTSPQVYEYGDMFKLDCKPAGEGKISAAMRRVLGVMEARGIYATQFEVETATAILLFAEQGCEYAVLECGMGGKDDATNAVRRKSVAVITSISLEHTEYLGKTIEDICAAKAGIIKNCPAVISVDQTEDGLSYFVHNWYGKTNVVMRNSLNGDNILEEEDGMRFKAYGVWYKLHAHGRSQAGNANIAMQAARLLGIRGEPIKKGLENARLPGRVEVFRLGDREIVLDGAHNPDAFGPLCDYLEDKRHVRIIYGCLKDKDASGCMEMLDDLERAAIKVSVVQPPSGRAMDAGLIRSICKEYFKDVTCFSTVAEALDASTEKTTVVCGTFTYLAEAREWIEKRQ